MKSAKERKMERKRKNKALSVEKTVKSRQRRLDNAAKRAEINAVDPDMKVKVIDQVTYDDLGTEIMIENGKIKTVELKTSEEFVQKLQDKIDKIEEIEAVEVEDVNKFKKLLTKWRL